MTVYLSLDFPKFCENIFAGDRQMAQPDSYGVCYRIGYGRRWHHGSWLTDRFCPIRGIGIQSLYKDRIYYRHIRSCGHAVINKIGIEYLTSVPDDFFGHSIAHTTGDATFNLTLTS